MSFFGGAALSSPDAIAQICRLELPPAFRAAWISVKTCGKCDLGKGSTWGRSFGWNDSSGTYETWSAAPRTTATRRRPANAVSFSGATMIRSIDTSALRRCVCSVSRCILSKTLGVRWSTFLKESKTRNSCEISRMSISPHRLNCWTETRQCLQEDVREASLVASKTYLNGGSAGWIWSRMLAPLQCEFRGEDFREYFWCIFQVWAFGSVNVT